MINFITDTLFKDLSGDYKRIHIESYLMPDPDPYEKFLYINLDGQDLNINLVDLIASMKLFTSHLDKMFGIIDIMEYYVIITENELHYQVTFERKDGEFSLSFESVNNFSLDNIFNIFKAV